MRPYRFAGVAPAVFYIAITDEQPLAGDCDPGFPDNEPAFGALGAVAAVGG
jgi:hypothetical protein